MLRLTGAQSCPTGARRTFSLRAPQNTVHRWRLGRATFTSCVTPNGGTLIGNAIRAPSRSPRRCADVSGGRSPGSSTHRTPPSTTPWTPRQRLEKRGGRRHSKEHPPRNSVARKNSRRSLAVDRLGRGSQDNHPRDLTSMETASTCKLGTLGRRTVRRRCSVGFNGRNDQGVCPLDVAVGLDRKRYPIGLVFPQADSWVVLECLALAADR